MLQALDFPEGFSPGKRKAPVVGGSFGKPRSRLCPLYKSHCGNQLRHPKASGVAQVQETRTSVNCGKRAKEPCGRLGKRLAPEYELALSLWGPSVLQLAPLAREEAIEADCAALLIVAVNGNAPLPAQTQRFVRRCARDSHPGGAVLVALLHSVFKMNEELSPAYAFLKQIADEIGLRFFSAAINSGEEELDYWLKEIHQRAHMETPLLTSLLGRT